MRGVRIQNIVNELNGEKIDVVAWSPKEPDFVANALSPAKVEQVWLSEESKTATVVVPDNQLSLAIGKEGQNARLAAKLTGWRIDIKSVTESAGEAERRAQEAAVAAAQAAELAAKREAAAALLAEAERALAEEEKAAAAEAEPVAAVSVTGEETPGVVAEAEPATKPVAPVAEGEAKPETVSAEQEGAAVVPPVGAIKPEKEEEEDFELDDKRKKGKPAKKSRTQKGRAKRRAEWEDELAEW
jgi:N utilization substance protein A